MRARSWDYWRSNGQTRGGYCRDSKKSFNISHIETVYDWRVKETDVTRLSGFTCSYVDKGEEKYGARCIRKTVYLVAVLFYLACDTSKYLLFWYGTISNI